MYRIFEDKIDNTKQYTLSAILIDIYLINFIWA